MSAKKALEEIRLRSINAGADPDMVDASLHVMQGITNALVGMAFLNISAEQRALVAGLMEDEPTSNTEQASMAVDSDEDSSGSSDDEQRTATNDHGRMCKSVSRSPRRKSQGRKDKRNGVGAMCQRRRRHSTGDEDRHPRPSRNSSAHHHRRERCTRNSNHLRHRSDNRHDRCQQGHRQKRSQGRNA